MGKFIENLFFIGIEKKNNVAKRKSNEDFFSPSILQQNNSDPSIGGDTPFKSCRSSNEIYCQEVSNSIKTSVTNNIKEQLHYDVWLEIENLYKTLNASSYLDDSLPNKNANHKNRDKQ